MNSFFFGGGFDLIFSLVFIMIFGMIIVMIVRGIGEWNSNNQSPRLTVLAKVVARSTRVSQHHHNNAGDVTGAQGFHTTTSTSYYITFEVESGERMELRVSRSDYGMLAEGDYGRLSFQGTRYLGFEREQESWH